MALETASTRPAADLVPDAPTGGGETLDRRQRWGLLGIVIGAYLAGKLLADGVGVFSHPGFGASLALDPLSPASAFFKTALVAILVGIAATFVGKFIRPDAGLFAAAIALLAVRRSGGASRNVYLSHPEPTVYIPLLIECVVLAIVLGMIFLVSRRLIQMKLIGDDADIDKVRTDAEPLGQKLLAVATQTLVFMVVPMFMCRSDMPMQVTATLFVAGLVASFSTVRFIPATPSVFFWIGPMVAGMVAYAVARGAANPGLEIGEPGGYFAAVARAMPLDFASAGVAGSLYGYWLGRKHLPQDEPSAPTR
jgi:hypothetical protein